MDLEYIDIPVKVFNRYAKCALCGGEYRPTDVVCMSIPPQYPHRCDKCGHTINLDECYPKIVYKEQAEQAMAKLV